MLTKLALTFLVLAAASETQVAPERNADFVNIGENMVCVRDAPHHSLRCTDQVYDRTTAAHCVFVRKVNIHSGHVETVSITPVMRHGHQLCLLSDGA
jgi:hypothetical protein